MLTRLEIFSHLSIGDLSDTDMTPLQNILDSHYNDFVNFCEDVKHETNIKSISCSAYKDEIRFDIEYNDNTKDRKNLK